LGEVWREAGAAGRGKEGSLLFLKKKKQKDFIHSGSAFPRGPGQIEKGFLVLFFKKEHS
jgi:hypothetical protein